MSRVFEYSNGYEEYLAHARIVNGKVDRRKQWGHYRTWLWWGLPIGVGIYGLLCGAQIFFACLLIVWAGLCLRSFMSYRKGLLAGCRKWAAEQKERKIRLEVDASGIRETEEQIQSSMPWDAVESFAQWQETVFIKLKRGQWAVVPRRTLSTASPSLDELTTLLRENGIPEAMPTAL